MIMTPMTRPADNALNTPGWSPIGHQSWTMGLITVSAKKPYTTVGIPARISRNGLMMRRVRGRAYSLR